MPNHFKEPSSRERNNGRAPSNPDPKTCFSTARAPLQAETLLDTRDAERVLCARPVPGTWCKLMTKEEVDLSGFGKNTYIRKPKMSAGFKTYSFAATVLGDKLEELTRIWLGLQLPTTECRYLAARTNKSGKEKILEIDAITLSKGVPDIIYEVKFSDRYRMRRAGEIQLQQRVEILGNKFPHVGAALIQIFFQEINHLAGLTEIENLKFPVAEMCAQMRNGKIARLGIKAEDLLQFGERIGSPIDGYLVDQYRSNFIERIERKRGMKFEALLDYEKVLRQTTFLTKEKFLSPDRAREILEMHPIDRAEAIITLLDDFDDRDPY